MPSDPTTERTIERTTDRATERTIDRATDCATDRVFEIARHLQPSDDEPIRAVVCSTADATVVAWHVKPGQRILPHVHPHGQDTWTLISGRGVYQLDAAGTSVEVAAGDVVVAPTGAVHGVHNIGTEALVFISVVCPAESGYALI